MFTAEVAVSQRQRALRGRRLIVVDIENVVGGAVTTVAAAVAARRAVREAAGVTESEQVVIGVSHIGLLCAHLAWSGARLLVRSGQDGADRALLSVLTGERIAERFDEVVLVSGDGIFADAVAALGAAGVDVTVIAHRDGCSRRLRLAAGHTVYFAQSRADFARGAAEWELGGAA